MGLYPVDSDVQNPVLLSSGKGRWLLFSRWAFFFWETTEYLNLVVLSPEVLTDAAEALGLVLEDYSWCHRPADLADYDVV